MHNKHIELFKLACNHRNTNCIYSKILSTYQNSKAILKIKHPALIGENERSYCCFSGVDTGNLAIFSHLLKKLIYT